MDFLLILARLLVLILLRHPPSGPIFPFDEIFGSIVKLTNGGRQIQANDLSTSPTEDIIGQCGYPYETHHVVTDDGYILTLHRILIDANSTRRTSAKKPPMLLVPGLMGDGLYYVLKGNHSSPAFIFNDAGYDVWLLNVRGTRYSRRHVSLNPDADKQYWDFSFHEMGVYDVPVTVNYMLSMTDASQLYMVGHSMGGTIISIFLTQNPQYSHKVKAAFLWSPALKLGHTTFPLIGHYRFVVDTLLNLCNDMEVLPPSKNMAIFGRHQCNRSYGRKLCYWLLHEFSGFDFPDIQETFYESTALAIAGTSVKIVKHFLQMIDNDDFVRYDYGTQKNLLKYNQEKPPMYDLTTIEVPMWIMYSDADTITNSTDVVEASKDIPNVRLVHVQRLAGWPSFSHLDFAIGEDIKTMVCDPMLHEMSKLEQVSVMTNVELTVYIVLLSIALVAIVGVILYALGKNLMYKRINLT